MMKHSIADAVTKIEKQEQERKAERHSGSSDTHTEIPTAYTQATNTAHNPLTRLNRHRQPLLHPRLVARAKNQPRLGRRHVAQDIATGGPFGAEGAAALDVGFVDA